jgi:predicted O-linked N-acetylglucosamine transferase (SPINDLY family)
VPRPPQIPVRKPQAAAKAVASQPQSQVAALLKQGLELHQQGQLAQARQIYEQVLAKQPTHFDALHLSGAIAAQSKNPALAVELIGKAIELNPNNASAYSNLGIALKELKRLDEALASYDKAIAIKPDYAEAYYNRGIALNELKRYEEALASYDRAIKIKPDYAEAYYNRGSALNELKRYEEALASYDKAIAIKPDYATAYSNRGNAFNELKRYEEALVSYDRAIEIKPDYAEAYSNRGALLQDLKRYEEALASYDRAIAIKPDYADAYSNRGNALNELKRYEEALASYDRSIEIKPYYADAYSNRGNALNELKRYEEALASYDRSIEIKPDFAEAYSNRGNALKKLKRVEEALASYDRAIAIKPDYAEAYYNRGIALKELKRYEEALTNYDRAIAIKPDYAEAFANRGVLMQDLKRLEEALASYDKAIAIKPDYEYLLGTQLHTKMKMCDWQDFDANVENLLLRIGEGKKSSQSFPILALTDSLSVQRKASEIWMNDKHPPNHSLGFIPKLRRKEKIKIGYYSEDFREHPVSYLAVELFELHDKNKFELIAFYYGPPDSSNMHKRVSSAFNKFIDIRLKSDKEVAELSRLMEIDIAIDLSGLTGNERTGIFAYRAAPVQLSYLGYLGTMGAEYYDYLIADKTTIPTEHRQYFVEKIVYLPSYQVNDSMRLISDKVFEKTELNLPLNAFVFCCFNNNYKITPPTFDGWMRILKAVPDSAFFLYAENHWAEANLKLEAEKRGVSQTRLAFVSLIERSEYLARYRLANLFLDTLPYNAGTTASDALWAGLPVLTCMGESFASRVAASVLNAIELPELVTTTQEQYEAKAIELATNPAKLRAIKDKLERNRLTTALFDTPRFTKHIEAAYTQMYERYQTDLPPDHIYIEA